MILSVLFDFQSLLFYLSAMVLAVLVTTAPPIKR